MFPTSLFFSLSPEKSKASEYQLVEKEVVEF